MPLLDRRHSEAARFGWVPVGWVPVGLVPVDWVPVVLARSVRALVGWALAVLVRLVQAHSARALVGWVRLSCFPYLWSHPKIFFGKDGQYTRDRLHNLCLDFQCH